MADTKRPRATADKVGQLQPHIMRALGQIIIVQHKPHDLNLNSGFIAGEISDCDLSRINSNTKKPTIFSQGIRPITAQPETFNALRLAISASEIDKSRLVIATTWPSNVILIFIFAPLEPYNYYANPRVLCARRTEGTTPPELSSAVC